MWCVSCGRPHPGGWLMIVGELVTVITRGVVSTDPKGNDVYGETWTDVADVLVAPGPRTDLPVVDHPEGTRIMFTLHFPKTFTGSLRGAQVIVRGGEPLDVVGDPQPYTMANTPTRCHMPVEVVRSDG